MRLKKLEKLKENEEKTKAFFAKKQDLDSEEQTKITLFLQAVKGTNLMSLSQFQLTPVVKEEWVGYRFFHNQFYRELELSTLLAKGTKWSMNPFLYTQASMLNTSFSLQAQVYQFLLGGNFKSRTFLEYLALSHAVMTVISFIRLLPPDRVISGPFWTAIHEIEKNNEVQQQVQVRLLKDEKKELSFPVSDEEKENIVYQYREIVENHFSNFLDFFLA
ncbi:MAG: hypothetical protein HUU50_15605 [Candidatus Brocadiae bacterium]|nr:hypothetical protein [Candidatus Brocadiia bacterium]